MYDEIKICLVSAFRLHNNWPDDAFVFDTIATRLEGKVSVAFAYLELPEGPTRSDPATKLSLRMVSRVDSTGRKRSHSKKPYIARDGGTRPGGSHCTIMRRIPT